MSTLTLEVLQKAIDELEKNKQDLGEVPTAFVITSRIPRGPGWKINYLQKLYILINKTTWREWTMELERLGLMKRDVYQVLRPSFAGIPVLENEKLAAELIWWWTQENIKHFKPFTGYIDFDAV